MWNVHAEPRELESLCGTVVESGTFMEPQKCGTLGNLNFMWKPCAPIEPWEPELLRLEPLSGTLENLVPGFGRLPQPRNFIGRTPSFASCWEK